MRSLEAINYRVFIGYESACSGFRLKRSNFPRHATGGVRFFRMCVQYINVCLRKKLIAASACCGCRLWWRWSVVVGVGKDCWPASAGAAGAVFLLLLKFIYTHHTRAAAELPK